MSCPNCGETEDFDRMTTAWICNKCGFEILDIISMVKVKPESREKSEQ